MKLERTLFQKSYLYFIGFFLFVLAAFWLTYFTKLLDQKNYRMHTHGIALLLWCLMLVSQAYLIRTKRHALHKRIGKFSYVVVPLIIFTTVDLLYYKLHGLPTLGTMDLFFIALVVNALIAFVIFYGLAILYRRRSTIHARYMVCTIFPMFTPVTDRIIHIYFPSLLQYLPTIEGNPIAPVVGFLMADLILIGLSIWDWRSHKRWNVFPLALAVLLVYHYSVLNFHQFTFWKSFSLWFVGG
ncbi:MAG: hypothetical protein OEV74_14265 [Cyclobacteriaceae bacterium]|nr:hypothetical protein [Cyclobacteriaceae bacterium]MDH4297445.1 hypothetical protein [Cyclobacteriaceae bacterium]